MPYRSSGPPREPLGVDALHALRERAAAGGDVEPALDDLRRLLGAERTLAALSSATLAFFLARRGRWSELDELAGHDSPHTRWGTARALSEELATRLYVRHPEDYVDRLAAALADGDAEVRKQAHEGLETVRKAGRALFPSPAALERLVERLEDGEELAELVYLWVTGSWRVAAQVRDLLGRPGAAATPLAARMREIAADVCAGRAAPPCPICLDLEEFEVAGREEALPRAARRLVPDAGEVRACPTCGTRYRYGWVEHETNEFGSFGTYNVQRLDPQPDPRTAAELERDLAHPHRRVQKEATRALVELRLRERSWARLAELVEHPRLTVRWRAVRALAAAAPTVDLSPLEPALRARLTDPNEYVRMSAKSALEGVVH